MDRIALKFKENKLWDAKERKKEDSKDERKDSKVKFIFLPYVSLTKIGFILNWRF